MAVDPTVIDGDRVIQFINAVKNLGAILETLNVIEIKDAFLKGREIGVVEDILTREKKWKESLSVIAEGLREQHAHLEKDLGETRQALAFMKHAYSVINSTEASSASARLRELVDLLDRLEHHNKSGALKILTELSKQTC